MTDNDSVADEPKRDRGKGRICASVEEVGEFTNRSYDLLRRFKEGSVDRGTVLEGLTCLSEGGTVSPKAPRQPATRIALPDMAEEYRIPNLQVFSTHEWQKALQGKKGGNPLGIDWEAFAALAPPIPYSVELVTAYAQLLQTDKRFQVKGMNTQLCLALILPRIPLSNGKAIAGSLVGLHQIFSTSNPKAIRPVLRGDWWLDKNLASVLATQKPQWMLSPTPWGTNSSYQRQREAAQNLGLKLSTIACAAQLHCLAYLLGKPLLPVGWWARTVTMFGSAPLGVVVGSNGVHVSRDWGSEDACPHIPATVEGVPKELEHLL